MPPTYDADTTPRKGPTPFKIHQELSLSSYSGSDRSSKGASGAMDDRLPMTTSRFANQQPRQGETDSTLKKLNQPAIVDGNGINLLMRRQTQPQPLSDRSAFNVPRPPTFAVSKPSLIPSTVNTTGDSLPMDNAGSEQASTKNQNDENINVADLKKQLENAKEKIAGLSQQLSQQQITQHTVDQALASPEPITLQVHGNPDEILRRLSLGAGQYAPNDRLSAEPGPSLSPLEAHNAPWDSSNEVMMGRAISSSAGWNGPAAWNVPPTQQNLTNNSFDQPLGAPGLPLGRVGSSASLSSSAHRGWGGPYVPSAASTPSFTPPRTPYDHTPASNASQWQPRPGAAPFAPTAMELVAPWNQCPPGYNPSPQQQYMATTEPINYRRLLDRNVSCSWKYIVDKIICSNDQQASIFLQQKLKVSPPELKFELVDAIIDQAFPLMINRFGNFLIQRCLEHGSPEQVSAIANTIRGKTLELSMDAFGCHVVQKALDVVPESYKASMVHELLRQIPQTVVHRYACHVWQKLFELRWTDSPPQIMRYVNEALRGMWHEVALGETGSLVVQNIFENCLDEDKRPCVTEVLQNIDMIACGQFGNWCIQHICEHGAPMDKSCAIEHVLRNATSYSIDQFASKVVEKCLKVGGGDFLDRYLGRICEARPDRPRMPLIDIAGDQYGNYLIQHVLLNAEARYVDTVSQHIRKHMVSLRGSKFGSRVAMLCTNINFATRPGPGSAAPFNDRFYHSYGGQMNRGGMPGPLR